MAELFLTWFLVFVRVGAMLAVFPIFSAAATPVRLRLALAGFLAMLTMPGVSLPDDLVAGNLIGAIGIVSHEVFYGLMLGFVVRLVLFSVALAGHYIGTELGLQLSSLIAPGETTPSETPSVILQMMTVMLIFSLDIHFELLVGFQQSYEALPIGGGTVEIRPTIQNEYPMKISASPSSSAKLLKASRMVSFHPVQSNSKVATPVQSRCSDPPKQRKKGPAALQNRASIRKKPHDSQFQ
jgi:type III secretory pathway component EscT